MSKNKGKSNKRLGRGLSSLIKNTPAQNAPVAEATPEPAAEKTEIQASPAEQPASTAAESKAAGVPMEIDVTAISPNPHQPRREFTHLEMEELTESIRQDGILQPLIVRPEEGDKYTLIAGERRLRAAKAAGLQTVPCVLRSGDEKQMMEWAVIENIQRADLNPIEKAQAYQEYMDKFELTQQELAKRMGLPRSAIANTLRMLDLSDEVQKLIATGQVSFGHAKVLAGLAGRPELQLHLARQVVGEGVSVRKLEELVKQAAGGIESNKGSSQKSTSASDKKSNEKPAYVRDLEQQLTDLIGTRVTVLPGRKKNTGKIVVEYYSLDDFDRISGALGLDDGETL